MAECSPHPDQSETRQQDVNEMFQQMGERLGWFQHKDLTTALQSDKKLSSRSRKTKSTKARNTASKPSTEKEAAKHHLKLKTVKSSSKEMKMLDPTPDHKSSRSTQPQSTPDHKSSRSTQPQSTHDHKSSRSTQPQSTHDHKSSRSTQPQSTHDHKSSRSTQPQSTHDHKSSRSTQPQSTHDHKSSRSTQPQSTHDHKSSRSTQPQSTHDHKSSRSTQPQSTHNYKSSRSTQPQTSKASNFNDIFSSDSDSDISEREKPCPTKAKAILVADSSSDDGSVSGDEVFTSCIDESVLQEPSPNGKDTNILQYPLNKPQNLTMIDNCSAMYNETIVKTRISMASVMDLENLGDPLVESTRIYGRSSMSLDELMDSGSTVNASSDISSMNNTEYDDDSYKQLNIQPQTVSPANITESEDSLLSNVDLCSSMTYLKIRPVEIDNTPERQRILLSISDENISFDAKENVDENVNKTEVSHNEETKYTTALEKLDECPNEVHDRDYRFKMTEDGLDSSCVQFESIGLREQEESEESFECVEVVDVSVQTDNDITGIRRKEALDTQTGRAAVYGDETEVRLDDESVETVGKSETSVYENLTTEVDVSVDGDNESTAPNDNDKFCCEQQVTDVDESVETIGKPETSVYEKETVALDISMDISEADNESTVSNDRFGCGQQATDVDESSYCDKQPAYNETTKDFHHGNDTKETIANADRLQFDQPTVSSDTDSLSNGSICQPIYNEETVDTSVSIPSTEPLIGNNSENSFSESSHTSFQKHSDSHCEHASLHSDLDSDSSVESRSVYEVDVATQTDRSYGSKNDDLENETQGTEHISTASESCSSVEADLSCDQQKKEISNDCVPENAEASGSRFQSRSSSSSGTSEASGSSVEASPEPRSTSLHSSFTEEESASKGPIQGVNTKKSNVTDKSWRDSRQFNSDSSDDDDNLENFFLKLRKPKEISPAPRPTSMKDFIVEDDEISSEEEEEEAFHIRPTQYLENTPLTDRATKERKLPVEDGDSDDFSTKTFPSSVTKHKKRHQKNSKRRSWCFSSDSDDDHFATADKHHDEPKQSGKNQDRKQSNKKPEILQQPEACSSDKVFDNEKFSTPLFKTPNFIRKKTKINTDSIKKTMKPAFPSMPASDSDESDHEALFKTPNVVHKKTKINTSSTKKTMKPSASPNVFTVASDESDNDVIFKTPNVVHKKTKINTGSIKKTMKPSAFPSASASDSDESDDEVFSSGSSSPSSDKENIADLPTPLVKGRRAKFATPLSSRKSHVVSFLHSLSSMVEDSRRHPESVKYVQGFKKNRDDLVQRLFKLYNATIFEGKLPEDLNIQFNSRLLKTAGYCKYKRDPTNRKARIELSTKVCDSAERVRDTLIHELCHAAVWLLNGINGGHGRIWQLWAKLANKMYPELPVIKRCHSYNINTKFIYKCTTCGSSVGRHSKSLNIEKKICGHCHGRFELLANYATPSSTAGSSSSSLAATPVTPRTPNRFALFVKDHYSAVKKTRTELKHGDIMKELSRQFAESKISA